MGIHAKIENLLSSEKTVIALLAITGILIYITCLPNELFWDDRAAILNNPLIKDWRLWPQAISTHLVSGTGLSGNHWRPLLSTMFTIEWHLWGGWPPGWHIISILIHTAAGIPLFLLLKHLFKDSSLAALTALLFVIHPAQTEAVVSPSGLGDPLSSLFMFFGMLFFARTLHGKDPFYKDRGYYAALACYALAMLARESGIMLIAFLVLIIPFSGSKRGLCRTFLALTPFLLVLMTYLFIRFHILHFHSPALLDYPADIFPNTFGVRLLVFFQTLPSYAGILFFPWHLRAVRMNQPPEILLAPETFLGAALFFSLVLCAVHFIKKQPPVTYGILWFLIALLPQSNLVILINAVIHEHFLYTALPGIWLAVFSLSRAWADVENRRKVLWGCILLLVFLLAARVIARCADWRTGIGFYTKELTYAPDDVMLLNNLGSAYDRIGDRKTAEQIFIAAIKRHPGNINANENLAIIGEETGNTALAVSQYKKLISLYPRSGRAYDRLAALYEREGEYTNARKILTERLPLSPNHVPTVRRLVRLALKSGNAVEARYWLKILQHLPKTKK